MTDIETTAEELGTEVAPYEPPVAPTTLFRTDDPVEVVAKATQIAEALKKVLVDKGMIQPIQGRDHVKVEGWITLGAMLGVVPVVTWTHKLDRGWEARVEARTLDGRVIGAAESECLKDEDNWKDSEDYAIRSMAQTRATSKALSGPLRFIVTLAGYSSTPAEEMDGVRGTRGAPEPSDRQLEFLGSLVKQKKPTLTQLQIMLAEVGAEGVEIEEGWAKRLSGGRDGQVSQLIERLKSGELPSVEATPIPESDLDNDASEFVHPAQVLEDVHLT